MLGFASRSALALASTTGTGGVLECFLFTLLRLCVQLGLGRGDPLGERRFAGFLGKALAGFSRMTPPPQTHVRSSYSGWGGRGGRAAPTVSPGAAPLPPLCQQRHVLLTAFLRRLLGRSLAGLLPPLFRRMGSPSGVPAASRGNERKPRAAAILFLLSEGSGGEATAARLPLASGARRGPG